MPFHIEEFPLGSNKKQKLELKITPAGLKLDTNTTKEVSVDEEVTLQQQGATTIPIEAARNAREDIDEQYRKSR